MKNVQNIYMKYRNGYGHDLMEYLVPLNPLKANNKNNLILSYIVQFKLYSRCFDFAWLIVKTTSV